MEERTEQDDDHPQPCSGGVTAPKGFLAAGVSCGIKKGGKKDLCLVYSEAPAAAAAVFTTNKVKAAPLILSMEHLCRQRARAVVINSGNANACTGEQGMADARAMASGVAGALDIEPEEVVVGSTGVIGVRLPVEKALAGIKQAARALSATGGGDAVRAIMTTDTMVKECAVAVPIGEKTVTVGGMAKGSGMIHPQMATMLSVITTDAAIPAPLLKLALGGIIDRTFNMITVDGDTSTNDMVVVLANGRAQNPPIVEQGEDYARFCAALHQVAGHLARAVVRDGEGASKFVEVRVEHAPTNADAKKIARAIATSNLVKTALYGEDANWGRILCAAGYSEADFDVGKVDIFIGPEMMAHRGEAVQFSEERAKSLLARKEIQIRVDLNQGENDAVVWTCDLTHDYVNINASYRS
ncbi:MAG: bifunctional glutamate N-acetyltransferase/amino-acid acetyltransferase ArgJ [Firmicutes bacterium]|nr:bifunctional glutamate N-acetyltransferase/amino-acid acetyltransferase ArgJ [Bacillota bacterium]